MPDPQSPPTSTAPSFEASLKALETIVHELEDGQLGLTDALGRYEQGVRLLKSCYAVLANTERRIELLTGVDAEGNPIAEPFDDSASFGETPSGDESSARAEPRKPAKRGTKTTRRPSPDVDEPPSLF